jgi:hypothetical protein
MTSSTSLIDLLRNPQALAAYQNNPQGFLSSAGSNVSPADIHDALVLLQDSQDADSNGTQHSGSNHLRPWSARCWLSRLTAAPAPRSMSRARSIIASGAPTRTVGRCADHPGDGELERGFETDPMSS